MEALTKLLIKIEEPIPETSETRPKWIHLCYVPEELCKRYRELKPEELMNLNVTLARWAKKDFDKDLKIENAEDLEVLKGLIKEFCKRVYPDIYLEQTTDRQGWLRVWVTKNMKEDLNINGE